MDFGFNIDNQLNSPTGFGFDGSGSLLAEPTGGLFAGDTLAYDPEERLVSDTSGSTILLANVYDGAGMRAVKTTASDGTTYFLDDAAGAPVVEETYTASSTPTTTLSKINAFGPAGLRARYTVPTGSETAFFYDPQGTVVNRISSVDSGVAVKGEPMTDVSVWDGYGQERSDQWTNITVDNQYTPSDPVGFEGQAGYYQDWELAKPSNPAQYVYLTTTPSLLTHRYYDASTGRFVNRDPIGYQGGANLYTYCGGNPVNETDPEGTATDEVPKGGNPFESDELNDLEVFVRQLEDAREEEKEEREARQARMRDRIERELAKMLRGPINTDPLQAFRSPEPIVLGIDKVANGRVDPWQVNYTQTYVSWNFSTGQEVGETALELREGRLSPAKVPIRVFGLQGRIFTLDNRRLLAFRSAGIEPYFIEVNYSDPAIQTELYGGSRPKFTAPNTNRPLYIKKFPY